MAPIRLRVCAGWSEALLVAHTTLLEISCHGSYFNKIVRPAYGIAVPIAYTHLPLMYAVSEVSSWATALFIYMSLHLYPYFISTSINGSDLSGSLTRKSVAIRCDRYRYLKGLYTVRDITFNGLACKLLCTKSLLLLYLIYISWFICVRRWSINKIS